MADITPLRIESPQGQRDIHVSAQARKQRLTDLLRHEALPLNTRCGQRGLCDSCTVELLGGRLVHEPSGEIRTANGEPLSIRACEYRLLDQEPVSVRVPARALLAHRPQVVSDFRMGVACGNDPLWQLIRLEPGLDVLTQVKSVLATRNGSAALRCDLALPATPPRAAAVEFRGDHWRLAAWLDDPEQSRFVAAIDIGTTTVALLLVELPSGRIAGRASAFNRQIHLGDDVLTRINLCMADPANLQTMQQAVVNQTIETLLLDALLQASATPQQVACLSIAANTTMLHLLAGVDPTSIGIAPFTPTFLDYRHESAESIHLDLLPPQTSVHLLPGAAAYIGADLTAGVVSTGMAYRAETCLLVDVGTNGEIILKHDEQLWGCATAAGPAFEGSRLTSGMRAGDGAISHIRIDPATGQVDVEVIGEVKPVGICGSAYVDFLAQARAAGVISDTGRIDDSVAGERLCTTRNGKSYRLAYGPGKEPIVVAESDISALLQAKAAIAAGIITLLNKAGLEQRHVQTLFLAGGFGMHLDLANTIACGLLPGFCVKQVQLVGNTSLGGAYMAALDCSVVEELSRIRRRLRMVELNLEPQFEGQYIDELRLPEPPACSCGQGATN